MTKEILPQAINSTWGIDTPNKININDDETNQGILYQALVVSNQMNGALYKMSAALRAHQLSGGYYTAGQRYYKGQIVKASVIEDIRYAPTMRFYECIADDNGQGIVDMPLYSPVTSYADAGGVRCYVVNPANLNTKYWRMLDGNEDLLKNWVYERLAEMKDYVDTSIANLEKKINEQLKEQKEWFEKTIKEQQDWVNERVNSITDKWKNLGTITGGTYNFSFNGDNLEYNCFVCTLSGTVSFGTVTFSGTKERSGCFLINSGGNSVNSWFTNTYHSFSISPWWPMPVGSSSGNKIWIFYKVHPTYGVCWTRG